MLTNGNKAHAKFRYKKLVIEEKSILGCFELAGVAAEIGRRELRVQFITIDIIIIIHVKQQVNYALLMVQLSAASCRFEEIILTSMNKSAAVELHFFSKPAWIQLNKSFMYLEV